VVGGRPEALDDLGIASGIVKQVGAGVSLAVPIEMNMRHGTPPIIEALRRQIDPSLSVDVEVTLTADMFTQMRSTMTLQRMFENARALGEPYAAGFPKLPLLTSRDVLRMATIEGARDLKLSRRSARSPQAKRPTSSSSTPKRSTSTRSITCRARSSR